MKRFPFSKELLALVAICPLVPGPAHAQTPTSSCVWPMSAQVAVPDSRDYPTFVSFVFSKESGSSDEIKIKETTTVGLRKLVSDYPSLVENSDGWRELQSRLNCQDRAGDYSYGLGESGGYLVASFSVNVEKYWCMSAHVPCPIIPADPLRMCRQDTNGKLWGARVASTSKIELQRDQGGAFNAVVVGTTTSSNTSNEQNFLRDLLGVTFFGPIGANVIQLMESSRLDAIKDSMKAGFDGQSFRLADGTALPEFPNYHPRVVKLMFAQHPLLGVTAMIEREVPQYPERTGCYLARKLGAKSPPSLLPPGAPGSRYNPCRGC